jgi:hypothetical protein
MSRRLFIECSTVLALAFAAVLANGNAEAAEKGLGVYLLGSRGPMAGFTPPPGVFFQNDLYVYSGEAGSGISLPFGGEVIANVEATAVLDLPTGIWVTPLQIAGGNLGFSATLPVGSLDVEARLGPFSVQDDIFTVGDPFIAAFLGWHAGNFHWQTGVGVNVPIGDYQKGDIANISFNRWATDVFVTATWLDPALGLDISGAAGVTFNGENSATNYETGTEFHLEGAVSKFLSKDLNIGLTGYYYNQLTGDSGSGAKLGGFEGEVAAIGATLGYTFQIGVLPVSARLKYFHEFEVTNRLEGDVGFLTVSMPLWVSASSPQ